MEFADSRHAAAIGLRYMTQKLLLGLIENEINSAFIFVAAARTGYRAATLSDGNAALAKAEAIYRQASELARDSCAEAHISVNIPARPFGSLA